MKLAKEEVQMKLLQIDSSAAQLPWLVTIN
jgi:hypothetical protein